MTASALGLTLLFLALSPGCGPEAPEVDKAAQYTPESLAQELAFRYQALTPEAKNAATRSRGRSKSAKSIAQLDGVEKLQTKNKEAPAQKKGRSQTLDDLIDEVESKLSGIKGVARSDACRQMSETIAKDPALSEADKKLLAEQLKELGERS
jgi:hypothetical protein